MPDSNEEGGAVRNSGGKPFLETSSKLGGEAEKSWTSVRIREDEEIGFDDAFRWDIQCCRRQLPSAIVDGIEGWNWILVVSCSENPADFFNSRMDLTYASDINRIQKYGWAVFLEYIEMMDFCLKFSCIFSANLTSFLLASAFLSIAVAFFCNKATCPDFLNWSLTIRRSFSGSVSCILYISCARARIKREQNRPADLPTLRWSSSV